MERIAERNNERFLIMSNSAQLAPPSNSRGLDPKWSNSTPSEKEKGGKA